MRNQVHYITLQVGDQTFNINTYFTAQSNWSADDGLHHLASEWTTNGTLDLVSGVVVMKIVSG